jgi:predicted alpha/beta-hydrolase family hydrolase
MRHPFLESLVQDLAGVGIASLRYQFPYMQRGGGRPDPPAVLTATVRAAINAAADLAPELRLLAGGKSLGGRMTSHLLSQDRAAEADHATSRIHCLVFFGFPLHPPGHPGTGRATHLDRVELPMLFFQGTRDTSADLPLMRSVCTKLGPRVTLHVVDTADHSFHVLKRSGTTDADVLYHLARTTAAWADSLT